MYLIDSNIFIRALQGHLPEATFLKNAVSRGRIVVSVVVIAEFYSKANTEEKFAFDRIIQPFKILPIDTETAKVAGEYRMELLRKSKKTFLQDCFLAAQAKLHHLTLVTNNKADFPMKDIKVISP